MDRRTAKVNISRAGGTAAKGSKTCKLTLPLPTKWVEAMGIDREDRELELAFDGTTITLSRHLSGVEFAQQHLAQGHEVSLLRFYDGNDLCSVIYADFTEQTIAVENQAVIPIKTAFGNNQFPNWEKIRKMRVPQKVNQLIIHEMPGGAYPPGIFYSQKHIHKSR